jgi:AraC-like DNA-binding protein
VAEPVQHRTPATRLFASLLADIDEPLSELAQVDIAAALAETLRELSDAPVPRSDPIDDRAVELARDYLAARAGEQTSAATLEQVTGTDRFTLARSFRRVFGTSPDRYRTLRRLELARKAIESGRSLVQAAAEAGFADQSHMTRQFKRAYGFTPGRWLTLRPP